MPAFKTLSDNGIRLLRSSLPMEILTELMLFLFRAFVLRPLIIFCCGFVIFLVSLPVALFITPSFDPLALIEGIARNEHLSSLLLPWLCIMGLMTEMINVLHWLIVWPVNRYGNSGRGR
ncbi:hypothetical protein [Erwinia psidii]|uniref:Uncharacterized protein n=1 Tax=Erwinia psidii TaxID=69224 RepID=A0A3N6UYI0_9GAMM|nr:hypothetical protein [Erwinia psidii]MCX8957028.1 hypothetical protein [Erwinia psidii]MCX8965286.1 hypothetical protein [Erwinia psidii]RQM37915.1 hypothetical protein EB241_11535 [Erwinia psidii]